MTDVVLPVYILRKLSSKHNKVITITTQTTTLNASHSDYITVII